MNPNRKSANHPVRNSAATSQDLTPAFVPPGARLNLCALNMGEAIEMEKSALVTAVCMNSCLMNICSHACAFPLGFGNVFEAESQALANCLDLEMQWLGLAPMHTEMRHIEPTAEELELSMDIAVAAFESEILA